MTIRNKKQTLVRVERSRSLTEIIEKESPERVAKRIEKGELGNLEAVTAICRELRTEAERAVERFFRFLRGFELSGMWQAQYSGTFLSFLRANHICNADRYGLYLKAADTIEDKILKYIGAEAAMESVRVPEERRAQVLTTMVRTVEKEHGVPLSKQAAANIVREVIQPVRRVDAIATKLQQKDQEIRELERRVNELERRNAQLMQICRKNGIDPNAILNPKKSGKPPKRAAARAA